LGNINEILEVINGALAIILVLGGAIVGGVKLFGLRQRLDSHEDTCTDRYDKIDKNISDLSDKVNEMAEDVAEIKGVLSVSRKPS